ncbi:hypothetical protein [Paenibacillus campi]|uniref:hypothetical protein n=1 Tax=Paenibacillus campi TaxID=3106031 RepID=UPI002AFF9728|nr:hypothetical protein [Paenibacillus sp. SGZ-1014]
MFSYVKFARFPRADDEDKDNTDPLSSMMRPSSLFDRVSMTALLSLGLLIVVAAASFAAYGFFYLASWIGLIAFDHRTTAIVYSIWTSAGLFMLAIYIQPAAAELFYPLLRRPLAFWHTQVVAIVRNTLLLYTLAEMIRGVDTHGIWGALGLACIFQLIQCIRFDEDVQSGQPNDKQD